MSNSAKGKPRLIVGSPATDSDLFGRDEVIDLIWERLERNHVFLTAPRRFGKTSVMMALRDRPREGWTPVFLDVEAIDTPAKLLTELTAALLPLGKFKETVTKIWADFKEEIDEIEIWEFKTKIREPLERDWFELGQHLVRGLREESVRHLVILDEFPWMIQRVAERDEKEAGLLLDWFRSLRQNPDILGRNRFLLGGSIGMDRLLVRLSATHTLNDVETIPIDPFSRETAEAFCEIISATEGLALTSENIAAILDTIGEAVPMFLVLLLNELAKSKRLEGIQVTTESIERAYRERVLGPHSRNHFDYFFQRLKRYYDGPTRKAAQAIIKALAPVEFIPRDILQAHCTKAIGHPMNPEAFSLLLTEMEKDFYIRFDETQKKYTMASKVLRDWWLRHYGLLD